MIVVDTSALMAIVLDEPTADDVGRVLIDAERILLSAGTMTEALIVAGGRNVRDEMAALIDGLGFEVVEVTADGAKTSADAYARWGKGNNRASLNFGDCFAYALAKENHCPLLFVGDDFTQTDVRIALS